MDPKTSLIKTDTLVSYQRSSTTRKRFSGRNCRETLKQAYMRGLSCDGASNTKRSHWLRVNCMLFAADGKTNRLNSPFRLHHSQEMQGVRALAVAAVFPYHVGPILLPGGFMRNVIHGGRA